MKFFQQFSIRTKIILGVSSVSLISMMTINLLNYNNAKKRITERILHDELPLLMDKIYTGIIADLNIPLTIASMMASHPETKRMLYPQNENPTKVLNYLKTIQLRYQNFQALQSTYQIHSTFLASENSRIRYDGSWAMEKIIEGRPEAQWFFEMKNSDAPYYIETNYNALTEDLTVFIDYLIRDKGKFLGITGIGLCLDDFLLKVTSYVSQDAEIYFTDGQGNITIHRNPEMMFFNTSKDQKRPMNIRNMEGISGVAEQILTTTDRKFSSGYDRAAQYRLINSQYIPEMNSYLIVEIPQDFFLRKIYADLQRNLLMIIMITLAIIPLIILTIDHIILIPLRKFNEGLFAFFDFMNRKTDYFEPISVHSSDEIGTMSQTINKNTQAIRDGILKDQALIQNVAEISAIINQGILNHRLTEQGHQPELIEMKQGINQMIDSLEARVGMDINQIIAVMEHYGNMDFFQEIPMPKGQIERQVMVMGKNIFDSTEEIKKQKAEIERQRDNIREQNAKITDSIRYAKTIQQAILPKPETINAHLSDYFIFFRPKDLVSGDFYWFSALENKLIFVAADCTGHGVPGAFMSMIGSSLLSHIVNEKKVLNPAQILENLNDGVISALQQNEHQNDDGMDLAMCVLNKTTQQVEFAGAKNPLFYIQNHEIHEIRGSRKRIGGVSRKHKKTQSFEAHTLQIQSPMYLYLFSDGFQDQFGNVPRQKLGKERFKEILHEIHAEPIANQAVILEQKFLDWIGNEIQIDDLLILGIKL